MGNRAATYHTPRGYVRCLHYPFAISRYSRILSTPAPPNGRISARTMGCSLSGANAPRRRLTATSRISLSLSGSQGSLLLGPVNGGRNNNGPNSEDLPPFRLSPSRTPN